MGAMFWLFEQMDTILSKGMNSFGAKVEAPFINELSGLAIIKV